MKSIQIPSQYASYDLKTLIICFSMLSARTFLAEHRNMTELEKIETEETNFHYSDKEGFGFTPGGHGYAGGTETHNKEHYEKVFLNFFAGKIREMDQKGHYDQIIILVPHETKNEIHEKLPTDLAGKTRFIIGNHYKDDLMQIVEKIEKS